MYDDERRDWRWMIKWPEAYIEVWKFVKQVFWLALGVLVLYCILGLGCLIMGPCYP